MVCHTQYSIIEMLKWPDLKLDITKRFKINKPEFKLIAERETTESDQFTNA